MEILNLIQVYGGSFLVLLTVLVFVHELGHYWVARRNGVRVDVFSIGFGPELFGWNDRHGTRWRFSLIPLGGYVKMYGDADPASAPSAEVTAMTPEEREVAFFHKRVGQRAAIVAAGPIANFLFAIVVAAGLYMTSGQPFSAPVVGAVEPGSAAARAGLEPGDRFLRLDGTSIERFENIQRIVFMNPGVAMPVEVERAGATVTLTLTPDRVVSADRFEREQAFGRIGVHGAATIVRLGPVDALVAATQNVWNTSGMILKSVGQIVTGSRSSQELGGIISIGHLAGEVAQVSVPAYLNLMVLISINLGLLNLFPIPMLDGGHLLFCGLEAIRGRPLGERAQEMGFRIGFAFVIALMLFATWNDFRRFGIVDFVKQIVS